MLPQERWPPSYSRAGPAASGLLPEGSPGARRVGDPDRLPGTGRSGLTRDVQMTSRRLMFIQLSQLTRCPLYVSPFFSSTSCKRRESRGASPAPVQGPAPVSPARHR